MPQTESLVATAGWFSYPPSTVGGLPKVKARKPAPRKAKKTAGRKRAST